MNPKYGRKSTAHRTLQEWQEQEIWNRILLQITLYVISTGAIVPKYISIDSTTIPAKKKGDKTDYDGFKKIFGVKLHIDDKHGTPLCFIV
jgi:hypothetical protein